MAKTKTKAMATMAGAALPATLVDPTGAAVCIVIGSGMAAATGTLYHLSKSAIRRTKNLGKENQEKREATLTVIAVDDSENVFSEVEFENCIRKLAASITGVSITGAMSIVLPHHLIGTAVNGVETYIQLRKLRKILKGVGGYAGLIKRVSRFDMALQILTGICIKLLITTIFLGHDFDAFVQGMSHLSHGYDIFIGPDSGLSAPPEIGSHAQELIDDHNELIGPEGPLHYPAAVADAPANLMAEVLGHGDDYTPMWGDGVPVEDWAAIGSAEAVTATILGRITEEPLHFALSKLSEEVKTQNKENQKIR